MVRLRVMTYNVRNLRAGIDPIAALVRHQEPQLLLLQECGTRPGLHRLAGAVGLTPVSSHRPFGHVRNAVLFDESLRLVSQESRSLTRTSRGSPRGYTAVALRAEGLRVLAVSAHLGLLAEERRRHARELTNELMVSDWPVVLGADLNEGPDRPAARWMGERLFDAFAQAGGGPGETFPAAGPSSRIDYLFVGGGVRVVAAWVVRGPGSDGPDRDAGRSDGPASSGDGAASDHLPLVADVELAEPLS